MNRNIDYLREKARGLPLRSGVYLMKDSSGKVIYVGKSRKLKNRVSSYFQDSQKNIKTEKMVSRVCDFDYILCDNEIEALTLENSLIKQYSPKYNIKLKDAKSYPYIKMTVRDEYPNLFMTRTRKDDGARYFGPYSSTSTVYEVIGTLRKSFGLPSCNHSFPQDTGKIRPCIYSQMNRCLAPCREGHDKSAYDLACGCALSVLSGNISEACSDLEKKMYEYSDLEQYESAARCRDAVASLKRLKDRQKVVSSPKAEHDVIATYSDDACRVVSVFYIREGKVSDNEHFVFSAGEILDEENMTSFLTQFYQRREYVPREILIGFEMSDDDIADTEKYLSAASGHQVKIRRPEKGNLHALCSMAYDNARQNAVQYESSMKTTDESLAELASLLGLEVLPERIEAYDISNIGREHISAGMIVMNNGKFDRQAYRIFKIKTVDGQNDYASMSEALERRFRRLIDNDTSFASMPDLIMLDGGRGHVNAVRSIAEKLGVDVPVYGMVKDQYHKTRVLTDGENEISIARNRAVYMLVYKLQEEVHRFTYSFTEASKRKTVRTSSLEKIEGIGPKKAALLLKAAGSLSALKGMTEESLSGIRGISASDARSVYDYFHKND
ncbi:MAG: excinuclease ABC subunit UvrC [Clostridia bacterium]|nr:excinuclease ABC subunit UvrC [Clostridia bacterium]